MKTEQDMTTLRLAEAVLLAPRAGDKLVLDDETLLAAIEKRRPLTKEEKQQLLASPLTLRRFKHLAQQHQRAVAGWLGSRGLLLAAAGEGALQSLSTEDGKWTLHFLPGPEGKMQMVLKCQDDRLIDALLQQHRPVQVRDSKGNLLCQGELDDEGELNAPWPFEQPPRDYFQQSGGRFAVLPA